MKTLIHFFLASFILLNISSCSVRQKSKLTGIFNKESFDFTGQLRMMSRSVPLATCTQAVTFQPAYPIGHSIWFCFTFDDLFISENMNALVGKNLLASFDKQKQPLEIYGYSDGDFMLDITKLCPDDFFIIEKIDISKRYLKTEFEGSGEAITIEGKMEFCFNDNIVKADYKFLLAECYNKKAAAEK